MQQNKLKNNSRNLIMSLFSIFFLSIVISCGAPKKYTINSEELNNNNSGVVLGKITKQRFYGLFISDSDGSGRGIVIKNKKTGEKFTYASAYYFEMRLPEGKYQLTGMGTPNGGIIPRKDPFEFSIKNGEIKYIGSIVADRDLKRHLKKIKTEKPILGKHIFSVKDYGEVETKGLLLKPTGRAKKPFFTFYVIDERDEVIKQFKEKYPELKTENVIVEFMN